MELRTAASPRDVKHYTTERLREEFLIDDLFQPDVIKLVYSHIDRIITGSAVPVKETLKLTAGDELRAQYFCERRELGVINIGGAGVITIDGKEYKVAHGDDRCPGGHNHFPFYFSFHSKPHFCPHFLYPQHDLII